MKELVLKCFTYQGKVWTYHNNKIYRVIFSNIQSLDKSSPGWDKSFYKDFVLVDIETTTDNIVVVSSKSKIIVKLDEEMFAERWFGEEW